MFTALRHTAGTLGNAAYPLDTGVLVHGFDVRHDNAAALNDLHARLLPVVEERGMALKVVRTNIKSVSGQRWRHSHASQLACVLHQFDHDFDYALIGSTLPYDQPVPGWGSNPSTDHLLSGAALGVVHDGAGYSRVEKIDLIAAHPVARRALKVCWQGADQGRNCGICPKCIGTRLAFMAVGVKEPECFDGLVRPSQISQLAISNPVQLAHLGDVLRYARTHGVDEPWVAALSRRLARSRLLYASAHWVDALGRSAAEARHGRRGGQETSRSAPG